MMTRLKDTPTFATLCLTPLPHGATSAPTRGITAASATTEQAICTQRLRQSCLRLICHLHETGVGAQL